MEYSEALEYISSGEAVLFAGSYFSIGSTNYTGTLIPDSDGLKQIFLDELGEPEDSQIDLKAISEFALDTLGPKQYGNILRKQFNVNIPSPDVNRISKKPWMAIFTTNYDNAIEKATGLISSSPSSNVKQALSLNEEVYHINGYLNDLSSSKDDALKLLLSNDSYFENSFLSSPGYYSFTNALIYAKAIFFVGYSISADLDIARIISRSDLSRKTFFITGHSASRIEQHRISQFGTYTDKETSDFANDINLISLAKSKKYIEDGKLYSLYKVKPSKDYLIQDHIDQDINNLIDRGIVRSENILNPDYIVNRWEPYANQILTNHNDFVMTVRSKIGNGKTIFMRGLAEYISGKLNVFYMNGPADYLYRDLNYIVSNFEEPVVFIDNMSELRNTFGVISQFFKKGVRFIISDRNPVLEQIVNTLSRDFDIETDKIIHLVNLDQLKRNDFLKWTSNIETYHLWGNSNQKLTKSEFTKSKSFSKLLINVFESTGILSRYKNLFQSNMHNTTNEQRLILSILILNLINTGQSIKLDSLINILNVTITEEMKSDELFSEFIDFNKMEFINASSILAREILNDKTVFSQDKIYETILGLMKGIDRKYSSKENNAIQRSLTSFSNLTLIFSGNRRDQITHKFISNFYSEVQKLNFAEDNVFLFIQLTTSKIYAGDYELANKYLSFAEQEARRLKIPDQYQLVTTKINLYVEFSKKLIAINPSDYLEKIEWSAKQINDYRELGYLVTVFSKLSDPNNGFLSAVNEYAGSYKTDFYDILNSLYLHIQLSPEIDELEEKHGKNLRLLHRLIKDLEK